MVCRDEKLQKQCRARRHQTYRPGHAPQQNTRLWWRSTTTLCRRRVWRNEARAGSSISATSTTGSRVC
uniref:Uncharacterized protein n=1 Tax=Timema douglasi TaxID=61478 RepID=A0A7R8VX91_TIMDO|nr:unnamed protein product [Timema douglasi]